MCYAELDGNKRDAFPLPFIEQTRRTRMKGRLKREMEKVDEINAELNPVVTIEHQDTQWEFLATKTKAKEKEVIHFTYADKEFYEKKKVNQRGDF
ncbi:Uncharacterised protein [Rodentibacter pneumotropicus]|uniref:Uncharacterized protein n=1 Tax=Rodentibacter pneumotropicus TaxID=758 RepID=A0A448MJX3_9PAST|nr:Uncharacterised protein [Rodentibacter pneumotropicus]